MRQTSLLYLPSSFSWAASAPDSLREPSQTSRGHPGQASCRKRSAGSGQQQEVKLTRKEAGLAFAAGGRGMVLLQAGMMLLQTRCASASSLHFGCRPCALCLRCASAWSKIIKGDCCKTRAPAAIKSASGEQILCILHRLILHWKTLSLDSCRWM